LVIAEDSPCSLLCLFPRTIGVPDPSYVVSAQAIIGIFQA